MEKQDDDKAPTIMEGGEDHLNLDDDFDNKGQPNFDDDELNDSEDADSANNDDDDMP